MSDYERRTRLTLTKAEAIAMYRAVEHSEWCDLDVDDRKMSQREKDALHRGRNKLGDAIIKATGRNFEKWLKKQDQVSS